MALHLGIACLLPLCMSGQCFCRSVFRDEHTSNKEQITADTCDECKPHFCQNGNLNGWACPYGINVGEIKENADCGMCLECLRSCSYNNVSVFKRPFASELSTRNLSEAWITIAIFTVAVVYSVLYLGHWPVVRDYVNIIDKQNWDLFGIYSIVIMVAFPVNYPGNTLSSGLSG